MASERFQIEIPQAKLDDLARRLEHVNWPHDMENEDWRYGTNTAYLRDLVDEWRTGYDWRATEKELNRYAHYRTEVEGIPIHYLRVPGVGPDPMPLLLSHGWPWTFWDYRYVLGPLSDPAAHGGDPADAFELIVPSLPGFVFSTPLTTTGINWWRTADLFAELMTGELGFPRFAAHGGDWGALVTMQLGHKYADRLHGLHLSMAAQMPVFSGDRPWSIFDVAGEHALDASAREAIVAWEKKFASHVATHVLDAQTLAVALHDSPVGLLSWMLRRRRAWADCHGDVERSFTREHLLTTIMLYWLTDSFVTSARYYAEAARNQWSPSHDGSPVVAAPSGLTLFEADRAPGPADWTAEYFNRVLLRERSAGGHFAPAEAPEAIVEDVRDTFRPLRG